MSVIVRQYTSMDAISILKEGAIQPGLEMSELAAQWSRDKETKGPGAAIECDGHIIGCAGIEIPWDGLGELWGMFVKDAGSYTMRFARRVKPLVYGWIEEYHLNRLQAPLRVDFPAGIRMIEWIGFKRESVMRKYHPDGCDAIMHSIVGE